MNSFKTIKEISKSYQISKSMLYTHIRTDPSFPVVNVGLKKKFFIDELTFKSWMKSKSINHAPLTGEEILRRFKS